jgi:hypothetical protein
MIQNIGFPGIILFMVIIGIFGLPIWLIVRSSRKSKEQARIADAREEFEESPIA